MTIAGGKRWLFRCRFEGKQVKFTLGAYPVVSLAEAREKALEAHRQLEEGKNPSIAKREAKAAQAIDATNSFELVAREWHTKELPRWTPKHAEKVLNSLEADAFLFHATTNINRPMSENTLSYAMGRMGYSGTATPHGFRALASTVLNEEGFDPDIIERQLAHAERNKIRAAYHRAEYLDDRRKMMQWWADFLDGQYL